MVLDNELLQKYVKEGSNAAFTELVQRHLALVYSTALRQLGGDAHLAQDVAQTVFTALARKAGSLSDRTALAGWLYLGTHHAAAQCVRSDRRRRTREQEAHLMNELYSSSVAATDWDRVRPVIDDAMHALNDADREAVLLRFFEHRPFAEIGAALHVTEDSARMRVERALDKLHALLARRGITSTTAAVAAALGSQAIAAPAGLATTIAGVALAGGATAGLGAAGATLFFMNKSLMIASVVAIGATSFAVFEVNKANRFEAAIATLTDDGERLRTRLRAAEERAVQAEQRTVALKRDLGAVFAKKPVAATAALAGGLSSEPPSQIQEGQWAFRALPASSDPAEARRQIRALNAPGIDLTYLALYKKLGFTAEQRAIFRELQLDKREQGSDLFKAAMKQSPTKDRTIGQTTFEVVNEQTQADLNAKLRDTFGEEAFRTIGYYQSSLPARAVANQLATAAFYSDTPLTAQQAEQLVDIIASQARSSQGKVDLSTMNSEAMLVQAQSVLSPSQMAALRQLESQRILFQESKQ
jgi:RNA polymerase sigma factor (sigma-70 family)